MASLHLGSVVQPVAPKGKASIASYCAKKENTRLNQTQEKNR